MPSAAHTLRAVLASTAVVLSLVFAGSASASGPLSGVTQTVSEVTEDVSGVAEGLGQAVEPVEDRSGDSGAQAKAAPASADEPAEPAPQPTGGGRRSAPAVAAVAETVEDTAETATRSVGETARRATRAATKAAEPVVEAAARPARAAARSVETVATRAVETAAGVAEPVLQAAISVAEPVLATVRTVAEPVLGTVGTVVGGAAAPVLEVVRPVTEILAPQSPQTGASADDGGQAPSAVGASSHPRRPGRRTGGPSPPTRPHATALQPRASSPRRRACLPGPGRTPVRRRHSRPAPPPPLQCALSVTPSPSARPRLPPARRAPSSQDSHSWPLLVALAAPGLGRRLQLRPELLRPPLFVSPPERPG